MKYFIDYKLYRKSGVLESVMRLWYDTIDYNLKENNIDVVYLSITEVGYYIRIYKDGIEINLNDLYSDYTNNVLHRV